MADSDHPAEERSAAASISPAKKSPEITSSRSRRPIPLRQLLAILAASDTTISRLNKLLSTSSGQETILATIEYVAQILHHLLTSTPWTAIRARLEQLNLSRASSNRSGADATSTSTSTSTAKPRLLALSSLISETRYNIRLFGLIPLWMWGSNTIKSPASDRLVRSLTLLQVMVNMLYQALENVAYLASKGVVSKRFVDRYGGIDKWYLWSTRMWFGHIILQFVKLWRQHVLRKEKEREEKDKEKGNDAQADKDTADKARRQEIRAWKKSLVSNVLWAPLCLHWSLEKGLGIPGSVTSSVSFLAGAWDLCDSWNVDLAWI